MDRILYHSRSSAIRAARAACRKALSSSIYVAYEGPDFIIHPTEDLAAPVLTPHGKVDLGDRWFFELRGPAKEGNA